VFERAQLAARLLLTRKKLLDDGLTGRSVELADLRSVLLETVIFAFFQGCNGRFGAKDFGGALD
jgi:hypothetical protein